MNSSYNYSYSSSTTDPATVATIFAISIIIILIVFIPTIIGMWKTFEKAGKPGWNSIVPLYNLYVLTVEIAQKPIWWVFLAFVPYANMVMAFLIYVAVAKKFGKSTAFGIFGLVIFPFVGWPMLGFGSAQYQGTATPPSTPAPPAPTATPPTPTPPPSTPVPQ